MKNITVFILIIIITNILSFIIGDVRGKHIAMNFFIKETKKVNSDAALGHYVTYRDIAIHITSGKDDYAVCSANLEASSYFDEVKDCLSNEVCGKSIAKKTQDIAPEILGNAPLYFKYIKIKNGIRRCD